MAVRRGALTTDSFEPPPPRTVDPGQTSAVRIIALLLVAYGVFALYGATLILSAPLPDSMLRAKAMCKQVPATNDPCAKFDDLEATMVGAGRRGIAIGIVVLILAAGLLRRNPLARVGVIIALAVGIVSRLSFLMSRAAIDVAARPDLGAIVPWQLAEQWIWIALMGALIYAMSSTRVGDEFRTVSPQ